MKPVLRFAAALAAVAITGAAAQAQAPVVTKVDPPNWWAGHSINPVRLLIRGQNLAGAQMECPRLSCGDVKTNAAGTYAFVDVTVADGVVPGQYPLTLRTGGGAAQVPFTVSAALPQTGRFQGFGPDDVIYLLMPDRFANGDPRNDEPAVSRGILDRGHLRRWHGGDLEGVRQKLAYLRDLGVTAIWINPIYDNTNHLDFKEVYDGQPTTAYHGYHAIDYYAVDERFGDMQALRRLVDEAHAQGIKIILDMVANHTSPHHPWVQDSPTPTWFNGTEARHLSNNWQIWTLADPHATPEIRRPVLDGWFVDILPDLNQDDPEVARYIIQNTLWWTAMTGVDGIRQDTWPYVPRSFWREWIAAIRREHPRMRVVGEVYDGDPANVAFFSGGRARWDGIDDGVDALFDFPLFFPLRRAFVEGRPLREAVQMLGRDHLYENPHALVTFLGLHDVGRFMGERGATPEGLRLAFTFLLTTRGTPLVYYGDEIGLPGGGDPDNRRDFPGGWPGDPRNAFVASGRTPEENATFTHVQRLLRLRAQRGELRQAPQVNLHVGDQQYVYRRGATVVALNNDTTAAEVRIPAAALGGGAVPGPDALGRCAPPRRDGDAVVFAIPPRAGCVF